jgi:monoamine oxidase
LAAEFGFEVHPRPSGGADKYCTSLGDWAPTKVSNTPDYDLGEVAEAVQRLDQLARSQNLESPASNAQSRAFDAETIASWCARELSPSAASLVGRISEGFLGLPEQVSFLHSLIYAQANGGFASLLGIGEVRHDSEVLPQGLGNLAQCAAESLGEMVRFNEPVTSIASSELDVRVTTAANGRYAASALIMAIPPAVAARLNIVAPPDGVQLIA